MMTLFGGFSPPAFAAYDEAWPLEPGWLIAPSSTSSITC